MDTVQSQGLKRVGRGRSAVVYLRPRSTDPDPGVKDAGVPGVPGVDALGVEHGAARRGPVARKVFIGDVPARIAMTILTGAPNPYRWCEAAIEAAVERRAVLADLVKYWFGDKLRLPAVVGHGWNAQHRAYQIEMEYIRGSHAPLTDPDDATPHPDHDALEDLLKNIMRPLQKHLREAGFDGLVWQAGYGNPTAVGNFMMRRDHADGAREWIWIDLESGVPALFPINPAALLGFYVPRSIHYRRPLFDDVDVDRLRKYVAEHDESIRARMTHDAHTTLVDRIDLLESHQRSWKALRRHERSIEYEFSQDRIDADQREWYRTRPVRWYARLAFFIAIRCIIAAARLPLRLARWIKRLNLPLIALHGWYGLISHHFRQQWSRRYVARRIRAWRKRKFIDRTTARQLRREMRRDEASVYITDFGMHVAIKPLVKTLQYGVVLPLAIEGAVSLTTLAIVLAFGGPIGRTAYTAARLVQTFMTGQRRPWVALLVGFMPVVGNGAYPAQLVYSGTERTRRLARFIMHDTAAAVGRAIPIWGGADTLTEHLFSRMPNWLIRFLSRIGVGGRPREKTASTSASASASATTSPSAEQSL